MASTVASHVKDLTLAYLAGDGVPVLPSGFPLLDRALNGGFVPGSIYVLGGFPGSGKTSFALSIARRMAFDGRRVLFLSLEMGALELIERALCQFTFQPETALHALRAEGRLAEAARPFLACCEQAAFKIEDSLAATKADLMVLLEEAPEGEAPELLVIDHIQHQVLTEGLSRADALANYMADLKSLAKRHALAILACSQFNRSGRNEKKAQLWHLKSSGALEEVADCVLLCDKANLDDLDLRAQCEPTEFTVRVAKHRRGPLSEFTLLFHPDRYEFVQPSSTWRPKAQGGEATVVVDEDGRALAAGEGTDEVRV